jgi:hypothetical protein
MQASSLVVLLLSCSGLSSAQTIPITGGKYELQRVHNFSVHKPGYTKIGAVTGGNLIVTSFEGTPFFGKHAVYSVKPDPTNIVVDMLPGTDAIDWPNALTEVPKDVFGFDALAVGSGFLVPTHATGGVWIMEAAASPQNLTAPVKLTEDKKGWFYHQAYFIDINGDGRLDILTARAQYGLLPWSSKAGEMIWLEQPATEPLSGTPWVEHKLADGPDFLFCVHPNKMYVAAPEYINKRIVLYQLMSDGTVQSHLLDDKAGPGFGCSWTDINGDGNLELLVTNHQNQDGSVFAYEFLTPPGTDLSPANFTRHTLANGFNAITDKKGTASPGDAFAIYPKKCQPQCEEKPYIFVSGDNSNSIFLLVPKSEDRNDWSYVEQKLATIGADVGRASFAWDKDDFLIMYVPAYDNDQVVEYKFQSAANTTKTIFV